MSAWQLAALVGGLALGAAVVVVLVRLLVAVTSLESANRELRLAVEEARSQTAAVAEEMRAALPAPGAGATERPNGLASGGPIAGDNGAVSGIGYSGLANPVIKARALGTGTSHAARRLLQRWER